MTFSISRFIQFTRKAKTTLLCQNIYSSHKSCFTYFGPNASSAKLTKDMPNYNEQILTLKLKFCAQTIAQFIFHPVAWVQIPSTQTLIFMRCRWLSGFVCAFNPAALGSSPKNTIYAFIIFVLYSSLHCKKNENKQKEAEFGPFKTRTLSFSDLIDSKMFHRIVY